MTEAKQSTALDALDPIRDVAEAAGLCRSMVYKLVRKGEFPAPVKIGGASRWLRSEVQSWISARVAERKSRHPARQAEAKAA